MAITHRDVVELGFDRCFEGAACQRMMLHSPIGFDASTLELWVPLLSGGTVVVAPPEYLDVAALRLLVARHGVTVAFLTTALFNLVAGEQPEALSGLRLVLTGGEAGLGHGDEADARGVPADRAGQSVRPHRGDRERDVFPHARPR